MLEKSDLIGDRLLSDAEEVLRLSQQTAVELTGAVDGVRVSIKAVYGGVEVRASNKAGLTLFARHTHLEGACFNATLGLLAPVEHAVAKHLELLTRGPIGEEGSSVYVPPVVLRVLALLSNLQ